MKLTHYIKRVQIIFNILPIALRHYGGWRGAYTGALTIYKREGFKGIVSRVFFHPQARGPRNYIEWVTRYDNITNARRTEMLNHVQNMPQKPLITVVMPTYNPKPEWLIKAIESVKKQIYPYWELCIADDLSTDLKIRSILTQYAKNDSRIKVTFREKNGHISAASNSVLELASGKWVALLDHDDQLPEHALYYVVEAINLNPDVRLIYSDEDKIDEHGNRHLPYFKCDWNPDLFYSHNMFSHLGVYEHKLIEAVGGSNWP